MNYMTSLAYRYGINQEPNFIYLTYLLIGIVVGFIYLELRPVCKRIRTQGFWLNKMNYKYFLKQLTIQIIAMMAMVIIIYVVMHYFYDKKVGIPQFISSLPCSLGGAFAGAYQKTKLKELEK